MNDQPTPVLSDREVAILRGIAAGHTYEKIARELELGYETVRTYVRALRKKLGLNKAGIAAWAARKGL